MNFFELASCMMFLHGFIKLSTRPDYPPEMTGSEYEGVDFSAIGELYNKEHVRAAQIPSGNGHASARGIATLAALMANGGSLQGTQIFSQSTVDSFHSEPTEGDMIITVNSMT